MTRLGKRLTALAATGAAALTLLAAADTAAARPLLVPSDGAVDTGPPSAPTDVQAGTGGRYLNGHIHVGWNAATDDVGVTAYDVYTGRDGAFTKVATTDATSVDVVGLTPRSGT